MILITIIFIVVIIIEGSYSLYLINKYKKKCCPCAHAEVQRLLDLCKDKDEKIDNLERRMYSLNEDLSIQKHINKCNLDQIKVTKEHDMLCLCEACKYQNSKNPIADSYIFEKFQNTPFKDFSNVDQKTIEDGITITPGYPSFSKEFRDGWFENREREITRQILLDKVQEILSERVPEKDIPSDQSIKELKIKRIL